MLLRLQTEQIGCFVLPGGMTVVYVSVVHPTASTYVRAVQVEGGDVAVRD